MQNILAAIPNGFYLFGKEIRFYGIIMALGMVIAVILCSRLAKYRGLKKDYALDAAFLVLPLGIIGARVNFLISSGGHYTFLEAIAIWNGGLSILGGVVGGALGLAIYSFFTKKNFFSVTDVTVPGVIFAQALGRWGNFFNQECYGPKANFKFFPLTTTIEDGVAGPQQHYAFFFYEFLTNLAGFFLLVWLLKKYKDRGLVSAVYLIWYGTIRAIMETFRQDPLMMGGARWSQIMAIVEVFIGIAILVFICIKKYKNKKQGTGEMKNV